MLGSRREYELAPVMAQNDEAEEHPKRDGWHDEEVDRRDTASVIAQKGQPGLRGRAFDPRHVRGNRCLRDLDLELQNLTVNTRCAPQRIGEADLADQVANVLGDSRSSRREARAPTSVGAKALSMPSHDRLRPQDGE